MQNSIPQFYMFAVVLLLLMPVCFVSVKEEFIVPTVVVPVIILVIILICVWNKRRCRESPGESLGERHREIPSESESSGETDLVIVAFVF